MLVVLMIFCAVGAIFLVGLGAYTEFQELWRNTAHQVDPGGSRFGKPGQRR